MERVPNSTPDTAYGIVEHITRQLIQEKLQKKFDDCE